METNELCFSQQKILDYLWGDLSSDEELKMDHIITNDKRAGEMVDDLLCLALTLNLDKDELLIKIQSLERRIRISVDQASKE